jgi:hypothetical protein
MNLGRETGDQPFYPFYHHTSRPWRLGDAPSLLIRVADGFVYLSFDAAQAEDPIGWTCSFISIGDQRVLPGTPFWTMGNGSLLIPGRNGFLRLEPPEEWEEDALGSSALQDWPTLLDGNGVEYFACPLSGVIGGIKTMDNLALWELH